MAPNHRFTSARQALQTVHFASTRNRSRKQEGGPLRPHYITTKTNLEVETMAVPSTRVYIGKLPQDVRKDDIEDLFKGYGVSLQSHLSAQETPSLLKPSLFVASYSVSST